MTNYEYAAATRDYSPGIGIIRRDLDNLDAYAEVAGVDNEETRDDMIARYNGGESTRNQYFAPNTLDSWDRVWELVGSWPSDAPAEVDWKARYDETWAALGEEANRRQWCGEYDQFAAQVGGPARPPRMTRSSVRIGLSVNVEHPENVTGRDHFLDLETTARRELVGTFFADTIRSGFSYYGQSEPEQAVVDRIVARLNQMTVVYAHEEI